MAMTGFIAPVLSFTRRIRNNALIGDVKANPGGDANITVEHMGPPGDDSPPLDRDSVGAFSVQGTGRFVAGGYADTRNSNLTAGPGEKHLYGRNPNNGLAVSELFLGDDGSILISNAFGSISMTDSGLITINGVTIDTSGNIVSPAEITASGVTLTGHKHAPGSLATPTESVTTGQTAAGTG